MDKQAPADQLLRHGAKELPSVTVDSYNLELHDRDGFIGDRASKGAFAAKLDDWRQRLSEVGSDPLGETPTSEIGKKKLDQLLAKGDTETQTVIHAAIEAFSDELAEVIRRFLKAKGWQKTERIVVGGGFKESRVGELAIARAAVLLRAKKIPIEIVPIRHHPDEAGLIGAAHLMPVWMLTGHDAILAVDIGGTNIRVGVVDLDLAQDATLATASVWKFELWRHADDQPKRTAAVERLVAMLEGLIDAATAAKITLAPVIGIGCPGVIEEDGSIARGGQNLPGGNWESAKFNLPNVLRQAIATINGHDTAVVMHNDAVVQGLSQVPFMQDVERWGALTIGTGLGNARYSNRKPKSEPDSKSEPKSEPKS